MVEIEEVDGLRQRGGAIGGEGVDLSLEQNGALLKKITKEGSGPECGPNKTVHVHYVGKFETGQEFDSSLRRGKPLTFNVGMGNVIKGWDVGIPSMRVGEKAILTIKPEYGYGRAGAGGVIPPNTTLVFEVELVGFEDAPKGPSMTRMLFYLLVALLGYYFWKGRSGPSVAEAKL